MATAALDKIPSVDIDDKGLFKYVLIKVYENVSNDVSEDSVPSKLVVRGFECAQYHADIYELFCDSISKFQLDAECLGGGRIEHRPDKKKLKVYGYSMGFGKADHSQTREILKTKYSDYEIEISDEGY